MTKTTDRMLDIINEHAKKDKKGFYITQLHASIGDFIVISLDCYMTRKEKTEIEEYITNHWQPAEPLRFMHEYDTENDNMSGSMMDVQDEIISCYTGFTVTNGCDVDETWIEFSEAVRLGYADSLGEFIYFFTKIASKSGAIIDLRFIDRKPYTTHWYALQIFEMKLQSKQDSE